MQATDGSNASKRMRKASAEPRLREWLTAGGRFAVWSWRLGGPQGKRKTWTLRAQPVTLGMLETAQQPMGLPVSFAGSIAPGLQDDG